MEKKIARKFKGEAIEMLTTLSILLTVIDSKAIELIPKFPLWKAPFFDNLKALVKKIIDTYIGVDNLEDLRKATDTLEKIQSTALDDVTSLNVQLTRGIKDQAALKEYFTNFGFSAYYYEAKTKKSQIDLIKLLLQINKNLDAATKAALVAKNINEDMMTRLIGYGKTLNDANVKQETFKVTKSTRTETSTLDFNDVYTQVMDVVIIAADNYKKDKALVKQLSYSAILKTVKGPKPPKTPKTPKTPKVPKNPTTPPTNPI
jgi:large-conductance mechanosensitive channel